MKILGSTLVVFSTLLGVGVLYAQSTVSANPPGSFVEVEGLALYDEECSKGPKAVIFLHDGVEIQPCGMTYGPSLKQFHVIRYDWRGDGHSPATKKPYYEADDVAAIIRDRKIAQAALVGSSHGGNIALRVALRYPEQISDLVLVGPEADGFPYSEHFLMAQMEFQEVKTRWK